MRATLRLFLAIAVGFWLAAPASAQPILSRAIINTATSGDNAIIAASGTLTIRVYAIEYQSSGTVTIVLKCGSTTVVSAQPFTIGGGVIRDPIRLPTRVPGDPLYTCAAGEAFTINLSGNVQVSGNAYYTQN